MVRPHIGDDTDMRFYEPPLAKVLQFRLQCHTFKNDGISTQLYRLVHKSDIFPDIGRSPALQRLFAAIRQDELRRRAGSLGHHPAAAGP